MKNIAVVMAERGRTLDLLTEMWKLFMSWYTFFFTANLVSLGWALTSESIKSSSIVALSIFWCIINVSGTISCMVARKRTVSVREQILSMEATLNEAQDDHRFQESFSPFPFGVAVYASLANAFSLVASFAVWIYILLQNVS